MATTEIEQLRALTDGGQGKTDAELQAILDAEGSISAAARYVWRMLAATYSSMVDVSESGSTRKLGDLYKNALTMADSFTEAAVVATEAPIKRTRQAVRR